MAYANTKIRDTGIGRMLKKLGGDLIYPVWKRLQWLVFVNMAIKFEFHKIWGMSQLA
jgi:hypothetical protein